MSVFCVEQSVTSLRVNSPALRIWRGCIGGGVLLQVPVRPWDATQFKRYILYAEGLSHANTVQIPSYCDDVWTLGGGGE